MMGRQWFSKEVGVEQRLGKKRKMNRKQNLQWGWKASKSSDVTKLVTLPGQIKR